MLIVIIVIFFLLFLFIYFIWKKKFIPNDSQGRLIEAGKLLHYDDITADYTKYPSFIWFSDDKKTLAAYLSNSPYHYRISDSDGNIIYSNRNNYKNNDNYLAESIIAYSQNINKPVVVIRNKHRHWALVLNNESKEKRLIHITS